MINPILPGMLPVSTPKADQVLQADRDGAFRLVLAPIELNRPHFTFSVRDLAGRVVMRSDNDVAIYETPTGYELRLPAGTFYAGLYQLLVRKNGLLYFNRVVACNRPAPFIDNRTCPLPAVVAPQAARSGEIPGTVEILSGQDYVDVDLSPLALTTPPLPVPTAVIKPSADAPNMIVVGISGVTRLGFRIHFATSAPTANYIVGYTLRPWPSP